MSSCGELDTYECLSPEMIPPGQADQFVGIAQIVQNLSAQRDQLWPRGPIEVCWEDETFYPGHEECRNQVREAAINTWGDALDWNVVPLAQRIRFVGWTRCSEGNNHGIRIRDTEREWNGRPLCTSTRGSRMGNCDAEANNPGWPRAILGRQGAGTPNGMKLNCFTPATPGASNPCGGRIAIISPADHAVAAARGCNYWTAAHEFGHALGLTHDSARPDSDCNSIDNDTAPNILLGPPHTASIMGGCADFDFLGAPRSLQQSDREWIRALYYPEYSNARCALYGRQASAATPRNPGPRRLGELSHSHRASIQPVPGVVSESFEPRVIPSSFQESHDRSTPNAAGAIDHG